MKIGSTSGVIPGRKQTLPRPRGHYADVCRHYADMRLDRLKKSFLGEKYGILFIPEFVLLTWSRDERSSAPNAEVRGL